MNVSKSASFRARTVTAGGEDSAYNPDDVPTEQELKQDFSGDWLFHVKTTACVLESSHGDAFDNGAGTQISRTFLPILCIACVSLVLWSSGERHPVPLSTEKLGGVPGENPDDDRMERAEDGTSDARDGTDEKSSEKAQKKRLFHVDFARICAVMCVIFEHSGGLVEERAPLRDVNWYTGCGLGNYEIRGAIAAGLEQNKVRKHGAFCLSHCGPPSCTLKMAETWRARPMESDCDCLKCTMFCMARGSYVDECLNDHTRDLCLGFKNLIELRTNRRAAQGRGGMPLGKRAKTDKGPETVEAGKWDVQCPVESNRVIGV
eukprot:Skav204738  [mRNA]  locus=scaffold1854:186639:199067:+ [translate_table: standard]